MRVLVYVEGPSDRVALQALLDPLVAQARQQQVGISFIPLEGKPRLLDSVAGKAANHLQEHPDDWVFALPDLYPMSEFENTPNRHHSFLDLKQLLSTRFDAAAKKLGLDASTYAHFRVHCLKHDLEVLLLAALDALRARLGTTDALKNQWRLPVEDQNDGQPPRRIVEGLFAKYKRRSRYDGTTDAPWILGHADLDTLVRACPQRFAPLIDELSRLAANQPLA